MSKLIIPIQGMHCRSCEVLIEEELSKIPEVRKAQSNFRKGIVEVHYGSQRPNNDEIKEAVRKAGYSIGWDKKKFWFSRDKEQYKDLGVALLYLMGIYIVLKNFGFTNINLDINSSNPSSLWVVLLVGLTAGFSTCMVLVGGLVLGASARHAEQHPEASTLEKFRPHLFFNAGRIISYALLGGALGVVGSVFQLGSFSLGILIIIVGFAMLLMGLQLIEIFPALQRIKIAFPKALARALKLQKHQQEYSHKSSMTLGALTFFLPCGFTQAMQLYAMSTGDFVSGAMVMGVFALGTAPGLLGVGGLASVVRGIFARRFFKLAGIVVILLSLFNISNGYTLTGWDLLPKGYSSVFSERKTANADPSKRFENKNNNGPQAISDPNVTMENGVQVVKMSEGSRGYFPNKFTIKKGVPVRWVIQAENPYSCASFLVVPKLGVEKTLQVGENIIEFTPEWEGKINFSCSMGMYTGYFKVLE